MIKKILIFFIFFSYKIVFFDNFFIVFQYFFEFSKFYFMYLYYFNFRLMIIKHSDHLLSIFDFYFFKDYHKEKSSDAQYIETE